MTVDPQDIPTGTTVVGYSGEVLGKVRESHANYLLVDQEGEHEDLNVPAHAIIDLIDGTLKVSVDRTALTEVDHEETVHREHEGPGPFSE